ncbi:hypothetical protein DK389_21580 [Methylobacterium durans]|uniref:Uncharacterized protein n=1 Tax=Methylobacterium durans TaxID=2202825 RepID=A0A2U8WAL0_9HYPH|nr:hypothetical protein DK389_21580 [Methylobacterium durans]
MRRVPLGLRVPEMTDEPAHGAMMRLAARHRRSGDTAGFAADCGLAFRAILRGGSAGEVACLAGFDPLALGLRSPLIDAARRTVELNGEFIALGDWSVTSRRWCPHCLADDARLALDRGLPPERLAHHRYWWDVRSVSGCVAHGVPLARSCRACGRNPGWAGPVDRCRCGASLSSAPELGGRPPGPADRYLTERLLGSRAQACLVDPLTYQEAVRALERLGIAAQGRWSSRKPRPSASEASAYRNAGMELIADWQNGLRQALDRILADGRSRGGRPGLIGSYGWVYELWIGGLPDNGFGRMLKRALREHAVANGVISGRERALGWAPGTPLVDLTAATSSLGMGHRRARGLLLRHGMLSGGIRRSVAFPIDGARLTHLRETLGRTTDAKGLRMILGVGKAQAGRIVDTGLIASAGIGTGGAEPEGRFEVAAAERFLRTLVVGAPIRRSTPSGSAMLASACRSVGVPIEVACAGLQAGTLRATGVSPGRLSLATVMVRPADLRRLRKGDGLTVEEAAGQLGIHHEAARSLRRIGLLGQGRAGPRSLRRCDVDAFARRYMPASEAARLLGTSPRRASRIMAERGVAIAAGPPTCRQIFYLREDAQRRVQPGRTS